MPLADPDALDAAGRRLSAAAHAVRRGADRLAATGGALRWQGEAARAFRASLGGDVDRLRSAARQLDDAAAALGRHAATVRHRQARLAELARAAAQGLDDAVDAVEDAVDDLADALPGRLRWPP